jgi:hypothetical protein
VTSLSPSSHPNPDSPRSFWTQRKAFFSCGEVRYYLSLNTCTCVAVVVLNFIGSLPGSWTVLQSLYTMGPRLWFPAALRLKALVFGPAQFVSKCGVVRVGPGAPRRSRSTASVQEHRRTDDFGGMSESERERAAARDCTQKRQHAETRGVHAEMRGEWCDSPRNRAGHHRATHQLRNDDQPVAKADVIFLSEVAS